MMKNCVVFAIIGIFAVYAQMDDTLVGNLTLSSNETLSMEDNNSTIPINEPINSKQTSSLQSSEKSKDDDNSHMTNVGDSVKNAKQAVSNAAASASDIVSKAAQSASNKVSEATAAAGHEIANVTGNGTPSFTIATLVAITSLLFNSIRLF